MNILDVRKELEERVRKSTATRCMRCGKIRMTSQQEIDRRKFRKCCGARVKPIGIKVTSHSPS